MVGSVTDSDRTTAPVPKWEGAALDILVGDYRGQNARANASANLQSQTRELAPRTSATDAWPVAHALRTHKPKGLP
jgi:hypothetical protein